jgi:hypothetical protein
MRRSPYSSFGAPSDVPFLMVQDPIFGLPAFVLGAIAGCRIAVALGAVRPPAEHPHTFLELLLGIPESASASTIVTACAFAFEGAALTCMIVAALLRIHRRRRYQRRRAEINERISQAIAGSEGCGIPEEELVEALAVRPGEQKLARKLVGSYLIYHATELNEVEKVIARFSPSLPRGAKRMLNHARLLTRIACARKLFAGDPRLSPTDLGAWIVLSEHWPAIAREVEREPQCLGRLQALAGRRDMLALAVGERGEGDIADLSKLLLSAPNLGAVATRLVHFE